MGWDVVQNAEAFLCHKVVLKIKPSRSVCIMKGHGHGHTLQKHSPNPCSRSLPRGRDAVSLARTAACTIVLASSRQAYAVRTQGPAPNPAPDLANDDGYALVQGGGCAVGMRVVAVILPLFLLRHGAGAEGRVRVHVTEPGCLLIDLHRQRVHIHSGQAVGKHHIGQQGGMLQHRAV